MSFSKGRRPRPAWRVARAAALVLLFVAFDRPIALAGFEPTGDLSAPLARAASALAGGGVLLAGGSSSAGVCLPTAGARIYDPSTGTFTETSAMSATRCHAAAVRLVDGRVLVAGGFGQGLMSAELFDPATGSFTPTGAMLHARGSGFTATRLADGRVLVAGGDNFGGPLADTEIFDPATGSFTAGPAMSSPRSLHTATLLADGRVLMAGGANGADCSPASTAEVFDPGAGIFGPAAGPTASPLWGHVAERLPDGRVLLAGGWPDCGLPGTTTPAAQIFDPGTGTFTAAADMSHPHGLGAASSVLPDGRILVTGGWGDGAVEAGADLWDPATGSFQDAGAMSTPRAFHAQATLPDGRVLVAGGDTGDASITDSAEIFEADTILEATLRVLPRTLNLRSRGLVITAFVGIPGGLTSAIDTSSLEMFVDGQGPVAPLRVGRARGDHDGDGVPDLMIKLPREAVIQLAGGENLIVVEIRGTLHDGTPFAGEDTVRAICPGRGAACSGGGAAAARPHPDKRGGHQGEGPRF